MLKGSEGFSGILRARKKQKTKWFTEKTRRGFKPFSLLEPFRNLIAEWKLSRRTSATIQFPNHGAGEPRRPDRVCMSNGNGMGHFRNPQLAYVASFGRREEWVRATLCLGSKFLRNCRYAPFLYVVQGSKPLSV